MDIFFLVLIGFLAIGLGLRENRRSKELRELKGQIVETKRAVCMLTKQVAAMGKLLLRETGETPERNNGTTA